MLKDVVFIYKFECMKTGRVYIGKTRNPENRERTHMAALRHKHHHIELMQSDYDKYGEQNFAFSILESVDRKPCRNGTDSFTDAAREKEIMMEYQSYVPERGYNYKDPYFRPNNPKGGKRKNHTEESFISKNIRETAKMRGMSIKAIETGAHLGNGTISKWGKSSPSLANLEAVANVLNVPVSRLMETEQEVTK